MAEGDPKCRSCGREEARLSISLRPCSHCRDAWYCSQACREADRDKHSCRNPVSQGSSFTRNCYVLQSRRERASSSVFLLALNEENKQHLLWDRMSHSGGAKVLADSVLSKLDQWNPDIARLFEPKQEPFALAQLRMLIAYERSRTVIQPPTSVSSFVALSYTWRSDEWKAIAEPYLPLGTDRHVPICKQMWDFLLNLRESDDEGIWIDQVCLDQHDRIEKTSAVASMDSLYASARLVFVALEDVKLTHEESKRLSVAISLASADARWQPGDSEARHLLIIMKKIFSARWFSRAWCFHEHHMSRQKIIAVLCEGEKEGMEHVIGVANLGDFAFRLSYLNNAIVSVEFPALMQQMLRFLGGQGYAYSNVIGNAMTFGSKFVRDKVTITLNICRLAIAVRATAAELNTNEATLDLLMLALAAGDTTTLTTRGKKITLDAPRPSLSWLQWPSETSWSMKSETPLRRGIHKASSAELNLDLLMLDAAYIVHPSEGSFTSARAFWKSPPARHLRLVYGLQGFDGDEDDATISTLACAIHCGLSWMQRPWHTAERELLDEVRQNLDAVTGVQVECLELLFGVHDAKIEESRTAFERLLVILSYGRYWDMRTCFIDDHGRGLAICDLEMHQDKYCAPIPSEHRLYVNAAYPEANAKYTEFDQATTRLAVATVLADEEYMLSDRLWLAQHVPDERDDCWRVVEKVCLLGCPSLIAGKSGIGLARSQRIVG